LETKKDSPVLINKWLIALLREKNWRVPAIRANYVCKKLGIDYDEPAFYRNIVGWLPDEQFAEDPPCPRCKRGCSFHGWQSNHFGCVVLTLYGHYFIISRRYKCSHCESTAKQQKNAALKAARAVIAAHGATIETIVDDTETEAAVPDGTGQKAESETRNNDVSTTATINVVDELDENQSSYTFLGYNARSRELLSDEATW
jgi:hypothetical protein